MKIVRSISMFVCLMAMGWPSLILAEEAVPAPVKKDDVVASDENKPVAAGADKASDSDVVIIVTASRLEEPVSDVASSATVITAKDMEKAQQHVVLDALRDVPALDVVKSGGIGGNTSVFMRGANSEHTLVLIDGVEANDPISTGRSFNFANLVSDNIERVEVVRGPQSVLYGSDAMGGVINIITKRGLGGPSFNFLSEGGSFGTYRVGAGVSGGVEKVNYSFSASRFAADGYSTESRDNGSSEEDGYQNNSFSGRVGITPLEVFDIDLYARYFDSKSDIDNSNSDDDRNNTVTHDQLFLKAAPRLRLFDGFWEQILNVSYTDVDRQNDNPRDPEHPNDLTVSSFEAQLLDIDWQHNLYINDDNTLTVGAEFEEETGASSFMSDGAFGPFSSVFDEEKARTLSYYAQDNFTIGSFSGSGGIRLDDHEEYGLHVTYRFAGLYRFEETGTQVRGTVGTGFKAPSLFQLFSSFGDPSLQPEENLGWDIGVDQEFGYKNARLSATFFHNDFDTLIDFDSAANQYSNIGEAETYGVEFSAQVTPVEHLLLRFNYTFTNTENKDTGEQLLRRAKHKFGMSANYSFLDRGNVNASLKYVGDREDSNFSTFPSTRVTLEDYVVINLGVSYWIHKNVNIFARVENLTNQDYEEVFGFSTSGIAGYGGVKLKF